MRPPLLALALAAAVAACGPKVHPQPVSLDEDLGREPRVVASPAPPAAEVRPDAPPGNGVRTGTITRARLAAVLDAGPPAFLRQLEVAAHMRGERFVGWQLVQLLDRAGPLAAVDVVPGDVLVAVNGRSLARPEHLQALWESLRTANELRAQLWRGDTKLELAFTIEPAVSGAAAPAGAPTPPASARSRR